jgi:hypothetical protein
MKKYYGMLERISRLEKTVIEDIVRRASRPAEVSKSYTEVIDTL